MILSVLYNKVTECYDKAAPSNQDVGAGTRGKFCTDREREREGGVIIVQVFKKNSFGLKILKLEFTHCGH